MMNDYDVPVKYTKCTTTVVTYDTGLTDWDGLDDIYKGSILRDKVVCKMDISMLLSRYFKEETIRKYRPVLLMIAKGLITDPVKFSNCIKEFIDIDEVFHDAIHDIFNSCPEEQSFGSYIIDVLADVFKNAESTYRSFFRGKPEVVICISDGYLYFSVEDVVREPMLIHKLDCEVLSYAKNWRGNFQYFEQ